MKWRSISYTIIRFILLAFLMLVLLNLNKCKLYLTHADNFQHRDNGTFLFVKSTLLSPINAGSVMF